MQKFKFVPVSKHHVTTAHERAKKALATTLYSLLTDRMENATPNRSPISGYLHLQRICVYRTVAKRWLPSLVFISHCLQTGHYQSLGTRRTHLLTDPRHLKM
jgi:hypothetical protein